MGMTGRSRTMRLRDKLNEGRGAPGARFFGLMRDRPRRLARPRTPPFHGDNTGSNPVGDANEFNWLRCEQRAAPHSGDAVVTKSTLRVVSHRLYETTSMKVMRVNI